jgi:hypothetical protein
MIRTKEQIKMVSIPEDVKKYLLKDEVIDKQFELGDRNVFASANRIFIKMDNTVIDFSFAHISNIEWQEKRKWKFVIIGIMLVVVTLCLEQLYPLEFTSSTTYGRTVYSQGDVVKAFFITLGVGLIIFGYRKTRRVKISVEGLSEEQIFKISKSNKGILYAFFRLVNERRIRFKSNQPQGTNIKETM